MGYTEAHAQTRSENVTPTKHRRATLLSNKRSAKSVVRAPASGAY